MTSKSIRLAFLALAIVAPTIAHAHSGAHMHGFGDGLAHPLTGLDHLLAMVAVGFWAASLGGAARWLVPAAFVSVMTLGAFVGVSGLQLPAVEYAIAASVVVLGLLVAFEARIPTAAAAALVGVFALFHGFAHGVEAPLGQSFLLFGAGFVLATAALHAVGLGLGALRFGGALTRVAGFSVAAAGMYFAATV
jgi:urease accessory protein